MAVITNGNIDQAKLLLFEKNFEKIANQRDSKLLNTPAIKFMDIKGISNVSRIDSNELVDVTAKGRNPDKSYVDMRNDNRKSIAKCYISSIDFDSGEITGVAYNENSSTEVKISFDENSDAKLETI